MKICISIAAGGHLNQLMKIIDAFEGHDIFFVTVRAETTKNLNDFAKTYYIKEPHPINLFGLRIFTPLLALYYVYINMPCLKILIKERPDIIVGNGGLSTISLSYLGKLMGIKIIYLESISRVYDLSLTGKIVYPISDLFLVQWENIKEKYNKAKYWGKVI